MKALQEIKDDYAKELGWDSFPHLLLNAGGTRGMLDRDYNEVAKRYAQSVAEDLRGRIAFEANVRTVATPVGDYHEVDKDSVRNVEIILP